MYINIVIYIYIIIIILIIIIFVLLFSIIIIIYTHLECIYVSVLYTWTYETLSLRLFLVWMVLEEQLHWQIKWKSLGSYQTLEYHRRVKICQDNNMFHKQNKCQSFHSGASSWLQ